MGDDRGRCEGAKAEKAVPFLGRRPSIRFFYRDEVGEIVMNTAVARRLALGDWVVWAGKDEYQPTGPGRITRITAHEVEVCWEGEVVSRYRRAHLHNLRHLELMTKAIARAARSLPALTAA
jgi:hypothetical protein